VSPLESTAMLRFRAALDEALSRFNSKPEDAGIFPSVCLQMVDWREIREALFGAEPGDAKTEIPLTGYHLAWFLETRASLAVRRLFGMSTPEEDVVASHEPMWRAFAKVPPKGWIFYPLADPPCWRKEPEEVAEP
jgi:hypothetical protein